MTVKILIADDHAFTLAGMQQALQASGFIEVCATVATGVEAVAKARLHQPDIALLDYALTDSTGLEVMSEIRRWSPTTRGIIVTGNTRPEVLAGIIASGIAGLCTKGCAAEVVIAAIRDVARGERVISAAAQALADGAAPGADPVLTPRERQVLLAIARGQTNAKTGAALGISPKTVDSHRMSLMRKLDVNSAPAMVARAIRTGLIDG